MMPVPVVSTPVQMAPILTPVSVPVPVNMVPMNMHMGMVGMQHQPQMIIQVPTTNIPPQQSQPQPLLSSLSHQSHSLSHQQSQNKQNVPTNDERRPWTKVEGRFVFSHFLLIFFVFFA